MYISWGIAQVLGIFFAIMGVAMIANSKAVVVAVRESAESRAILFLWGIFALLMGAIIVVMNNTWTSGLPLLVAIIGWLALIKGAFILILPGGAAWLYRKFDKNGLIIFCGLVAFILGLVLFYW